jgi:membrane-associated phospholipid phosphatase
LVKVVFKRKRPVLNRDDMIATGGVDKYSFPSGHSSRAILMSNLVAALYSFEAFAFSYFLIILWSYLTCMSRVMLARHHFFDVVAGILLGYAMYFATILLF